MKIILLALLLALSAGQLQAQREKSPSISVQKKDYIKSKNLTPFVGVWEYRTATEIFTIELRKGIVHYSDRDIEMVFGAHKYVKNGVSVEDYMHFVSNIYSHNMTVAADNRFNVPGNMVKGRFSDDKRDKLCPLRITLVSGKTDEARWQLFEPEGANFIIDGVHTMPPEGFSVPSDVIMKKIK